MVANIASALWPRFGLGTRWAGVARLASVVIAALGVSEHALAYCRTTTCDVTSGECARDVHGCATVGHALSWPSGCIPVRVEGGSRLRGISVDDVRQAATKALGTWTQAECGGGSLPSLTFQVAATEDMKGVVDGASAVRFRDRDWPHHDLNTNVALTTLTIDKTTGHVLNADVELNSFAQPFFSDGSLSKYDLELVLLHEMGHVLGLGHSRAATSKMSASYFEPSHGLRWLSGDDELGVCSAYPPTRSPMCLATMGEFSLCETLEECRWVALALLCSCWGVFGVFWRYRYRVYVSRRKAHGRPLGA
jgi:hypothetical protein